VYLTLLFLPAIQTCCSEGEDGYEELFNEEFLACAALIPIRVVFGSFRYSASRESYLSP
jgi:hypothetical protein